MVRDVALGFDVGTTSVKAGLLWLDGDGPPETVSHPYATTQPQPGWVEQDPAAWLKAMRTCLADLAGRAGAVRFVSIGICSQVNSHLVVDEALAPLYPTINWQDTRAAAEAAELDRRVEARRTELWGGPFRIDASYSLARLLWLWRHESAAMATARWILSPKDYVVATLSGEVITDPISPVGLVGADDHYISAVTDLVDDARRMLPPLRAFDEPAGATRADNPIGLPEGIPVAVGTMDAWASVFGSGLVRRGQAMEVSGTSEVIAVVSDRMVPTAGIISFSPVHGRYLHAGPTQAGGSALTWAAGAFARTPEQMLALAAQALQDPQPILFLPHLAGERAPYWNADARGAFLGMTSATELRHLALAVLEGVAFAARQVLLQCEQAGGLQALELRLSGGAARSATWNQVKADVHGRDISLLETLDSGVLGAALMGLVAAGIETDLESAASRRVRIAEKIEPRPGARPRLDDLYATYLDSYQALEPVFTSLADLRPRP